MRSDLISPFPLFRAANTDSNNGGGGSLTPEQKMLIGDKKLKVRASHV